MQSGAWNIKSFRAIELTFSQMGFENMNRAKTRMQYGNDQEREVRYASHSCEKEQQQTIVNSTV